MEDESVSKALPRRERRLPLSSRSRKENCLRILLVDDDIPSTEALKEMLEGAGYDVVCAENGREALARLHETGPICVILLDIMMPGMNGFEFREAQLKDPTLASIPVVVVTADGRAR